MILLMPYVSKRESSCCKYIIFESVHLAPIVLLLISIQIQVGRPSESGISSAESSSRLYKDGRPRGAGGA